MSRIANLCRAAALMLCLLLAVGGAAEEAGTVGIGVAQLYNETDSDHRGELVALDVPANYPAAQAGIKVGDLIIEVNGSSVRGRNIADIARELHGPPGGTVKLKVLHLADGVPRDFTLTRIAYLPEENSAADPFRLVAPGNWHSERHLFPLEWAPSISYKGIEEIRFAPGFGDPALPDYFSYLYVWWINGKPEVTAKQLETDLAAYYRGLSEGFAQEGKFSFDASRIGATLAEPQQPVLRQQKLYRGDVTTYTNEGKAITMHVDAVVMPCRDSNNTAVLFTLSPQPRTADVWARMDKIKETFSCTR